MKKEKLYIFVDETGTPYKSRSSKEYFFGVQAICIYESEYKKMVESWNKIRLNFFGNDFVTFHSNDINQKKGPFRIFYNEEVLKLFVSEILNNFQCCHFQPIFVVLHKEHYFKKYGSNTIDLYELCLGLLLERVGRVYECHEFSFVFESRGKKENNSLRKEFLALLHTSSKQHWISSGRFSQISQSLRSDKCEIQFYSKGSKIVGLEVADFCGYDFIQKLKGVETAGWDILKHKFNFIDVDFYRFI